MEEKRCRKCGKLLAGEKGQFFKIEKEGQETSYICLDCFNDLWEKKHDERLTEEDLKKKIEESKNIVAYKEIIAKEQSWVYKKRPEIAEEFEGILSPCDDFWLKNLNNLGFLTECWLVIGNIVLLSDRMKEDIFLESTKSLLKDIVNLIKDFELSESLQ